MVFPGLAGLIGLGFGLLVAVGPPRALALECRPNGPIFPRPDLSRSRVFQAAADEMTRVLDAAINGTIKAGWDLDKTSVSVALVSRYQQQGNRPIWEYHHLAQDTILGTDDLTRDSQYQIGSISKAITDAVLIRSGLNLDDPITNYLPGLGGSPSLIQWETITLRQLGSHLAGIPPNLGVSEFYAFRDYFEYMGFPHLNDTDFEICDVFGLTLGCTRSQYIVGMKNSHPVAPPNTRPVYSNVAFTLLMYAVGVQTGQTYAGFLYEYVTGPLNMFQTYPSPGVFDEAAIPPVTNSWGFWFGDATPGGGLVSSLADLSAFLHAILTYTIFDSPAKVREWLQPHSFTGSPHSFFGMPWEIFRPPPQAVFPNYDPETEAGGHTLTIFTKDGAASGYRARISSIDEYGIGLVLLAAGDPAAVTVINDAMLRVLVTAVDEAAREQVKDQGYAGTFVGNCDDVPFNATVEVDDHSMVLRSMYRNGKDIMVGLYDFFHLTYGSLIPNYYPGDILRLYPTDVTVESRTVGGRTVIKEDWRFVWDVHRGFRESEMPGAGASSYDCLAWEGVDWMYYGSQSIDRLVFVKDPDTGEVLDLEVPFLRSVGSQNPDVTSCPDRDAANGDAGAGGPQEELVDPGEGVGEEFRPGSPIGEADPGDAVVGNGDEAPLQPVLDVPKEFLDGEDGQESPPAEGQDGDGDDVDDVDDVEEEIEDGDAVEADSE